FHGGIARAAGNSRLEAAVVEARGEMFVPVDHLVFEDQVEASRVEHKEIFEAIKRGDSARAAEAMERHILHAKDELKRLALQEEG
ncbi:FCD domain-containing protein, partial [Streptomyces sp. NPDC050698]